jgi:hypothetical protein
MRTRCALCAVALVLVGLSGSATSVGADPGAPGTGTTVAGGNGYGSDPNQLSEASGVALDDAGNLYVADYTNYRIQRWAPGATVGVTVAGGNGQGSDANQLSLAADVALDGAGNIYVADTINQRVQRWAPGGTVGVTVAGGNGEGSGADQFSTPLGLSVDAAGNVYVADLYNHRVQRWAVGATTGVTVAGGNGDGNGAAQLAYPWGVDVDGSGNVYVADTLNDRVQRWAPGATSGVTVAGGNGAGTGSRQLEDPQGVDVDDRGDLYVADATNERVQLWEHGATFGRTVAGGHGTGSGANQLHYPRRAVVDGSGYLYVADSANFRVQRWDPVTPTVLPGSAATLETDAGTATVDVPVSLSRPYVDTVTVEWHTLPVPGDSAGRADPGTDFVPSSGTVTFAPGETATTASILVHGDTAVEPNEYFVVSFHDPTNATIGGYWGLGFAGITADDDVLVPGVAAATEGATESVIEVPITLSDPPAQTVTVQWNTLVAAGASGDQADPATDYTPASGTVSFAPGETAKTVPIVVTGDSTVEADEYVVVSFHDPTNGALGGFWGLGLGTIIDDD